MDKKGTWLIKIVKRNTVCPDKTILAEDDVVCRNFARNQEKKYREKLGECTMNLCPRYYDTEGK